MTPFTSGWMRELVRPKQAAVPWARVARCAVAIAAPVAVGATIGELGVGLLVAIGALTGALTDTDGPYLSRVIRMVVVAAGGTIGFALGSLANHSETGAAVLILAGGLVAALVSVIGGLASSASLQFLIFLIVGSGADFGPVPDWLPPLCYVAGVAWALLLSLSAAPGRRSAPERFAVAEVYRFLALLMESGGQPEGEVDARRHDLTAAMNTAYDAVITRRALTAGRESQVRTLAALLNAATPVVETTTALLRTRRRLPIELVARVREISSRIRHGGPRGEEQPVLASGGAGTAEQRLLAREIDRVEEVLRAGLRRGLAGRGSRPATASRHDEAASGEIPQAAAASSPVTQALSMAGLTTSLPLPGTSTTAVHTVLDAMRAGPATWQPILRLVLCLAVAEAVALIDPVPRPYWIVMTVAIVMKPDFGSVFARAVQRGTGTLVGVVVGSALIAVAGGLVVPILAIAVFAALLPVAQRRNYGMYATFLTPLIVLLLDLGRSGGGALVVERLVDTAIGCAIVLLIGYLPWPDTWRSRGRLGARAASAIDLVRDYVVAALAEGGPSSAAARATGASRQSARRKAYRALADLRTTVQQSLAEPPAISSLAAHWWPALVALERVADAVTGVVVGIHAGRARPSADGVAAVVAALDSLAARLRGEPVEAATPAPRDDPVLAGVSAELRTAQLVFDARAAS